MEIHARFTHDRLDYTQDHNTHLVVSLEAPALDWVKKRPQVAVLPVIDMSGSMEGGKLLYAKKSAIKLLEHLQPGDITGLIIFDDVAQVVIQPQEVTAKLKEQMRQAIEQLHTGGGTNFAEAMAMSVHLIQKLDLAPSYLHRIIMFTDGQPTSGITDKGAILRMLRESRQRATLSAFGYGNGSGPWNSCDQDFLGELATLGDGNYAFVKEPDDALAAFGKELGGLLSTYGTGLLVDVEPVAGHQVKRVITDVEHEEDVTGKIEIPIASILSEETRHLVFEVELAKQKKAFPRQTTVFNLGLSYSVLTESGQRETRTAKAKAQVRFVKPGDAQAEPHKEVDQIVALHQTIRAQLEAEEEAKKGNFQLAAQQMQLVGQNVAARGHVNVAAAAQQTSSYLVSADVYAGNAGYLRSFARGGTRAYACSQMDEGASDALADCQVSLSNRAMGLLRDSFTNDEAPVVTSGVQNSTGSGLIIPSNLSAGTTDNSE